MGDDSDFSWLRQPQSAPPRRPTVPDLERIPRWRLTMPGHTVEAYARTTPEGPELLIKVDDVLFWSHVYGGIGVASFAAAVEAKRAEFEAAGWQR
jgi:hypothetical protein